MISATRKPDSLKASSQIKQRSQRCCKPRIRKLSISCTIIKLSETVMPEGIFSSGALTVMQYQLLNSAQFYPVLSLFAVLLKLLLVHVQQRWPMTRMKEAAGKAGGWSHIGESGSTSGEVSKHYSSNGLILSGPFVITVRVDYNTAEFPPSFPARSRAETFGICDELSWPQHF